jgi:hypothetical protein
VPRSLAAVVLARVGALSPAAQDLVVAAAVLGHRCELTAAAALAGLSDPLRPLGEAATAGILIEQLGEAATGIGFVHRLVQRAVYEGVSPARRRLLHERAAGLVDRHRALRHRVAAALGPDDGLAGELEVPSQDARRHGRTAQAAAWLAQAAAVSSRPEAAQRRLQDALEIQVSDGELAEAEVLAARVMTARPTARRSMLLGRLDFLAGRTAAAETGLLEAWHAHDRALQGAVGVAAALQLAVLCLNAGRIQEGITWAERAATSFAPAATRRQAQGLLAIALFADGRGPEGLAQLAFLPAAPSDVPREDTGALVLRGMAKVLAEDLAGAIADLSAAAARGLPDVHRALGHRFLVKCAHAGTDRITTRQAARQPATIRDQRSLIHAVFGEHRSDGIGIPADRAGMHVTLEDFPVREGHPLQPTGVRDAGSQSAL